MSHELANYASTRDVVPCIRRDPIIYLVYPPQTSLIKRNFSLLCRTSLVFQSRQVTSHKVNLCRSSSSQLMQNLADIQHHKGTWSTLFSLTFKQSPHSPWLDRALLRATMIISEIGSVNCLSSVKPGRTWPGIRHSNWTWTAKEVLFFPLSFFFIGEPIDATGGETRQYCGIYRA